MTDPFEVTLLGCDGSTWALTDPTSPVQLAGGLGGLHLPKVSHRWSTSARRAGRRWKGSVTDSRAFTMNLLVGEGTGAYDSGWRSLDGVFWQALSTDAQATLVVGGNRSLTFRLDEDNGFDFADAPGLFGLVKFPINCIADDPFWRGNEATTEFQFHVDAAVNYYGGAGGLGPPYIISGSSLFTTAHVPNPGDQPAWPVWTITGPTPSARVGVGDSVISVPFALNDGDVIILDALNETITDPQGNNLWPLMGYSSVPWAPIPPGDLVPISIGMDSPGVGAQIAVTLTPLFRRAWGASASSVSGTPGGTGDDGGFGTSSFGTSSFGGVA